ncbi:hypothetical protein ACFQ78_37545 [Streptomyces sp. NPDC056519]|uniref:hypothetical protein n=1 Tax=Streptomyces sp. NPDC056519 TaxID=3345849 RepID=UPI0036C8FA0F
MPRAGRGRIESPNVAASDWKEPFTAVHRYAQGTATGLITYRALDPAGAVAP